MRLPGCTRPVAGPSAMFIIRRGARLKKLVLRSGSRVSTAATRNCDLPSRTLLPTGAFSALTSRSSSHTVPGCGTPAAGAARGTHALDDLGAPGMIGEQHDVGAK